MYAFLLERKTPRLSSFQLDKLADIFIGMGMLFFASGVVPYLVPGLDKPPFSVLFFGLAGSLAAWSFALWLVKRRKE